MAKKTPKDKAARPPRKRRFDLHKALFVLPNAFTAGSIFCGFYAILVCTSGQGGKEFFQAALAIFYGTLFDMFDGRVARLTRTQSEFGREFDSLADVITFGVAPGVLVYKWALSGFGAPGMVVAFLYTACGAIRLARFNVLASRPGGSSKHFIGLPIPLAAGALVSLVYANHQMAAEMVSAQTVLVLVVVLSFLMVSTVRYRSFKDLKLSGRSMTVLLTLMLLIVYFSYQLSASLVMMFFVWGYLVVGMVEEVVFFRRRRLASAAQAAPGLPTAPDEKVTHHP